MLSFLKTKKSAGVPVTAAVQRLIARGNEARKQGDWDDSAENYRAAVTADPTLAHIWIQLGHAEKERGRLGDAEAAYARAAMLQPDDAEPLLHLGHIYKLLGNVAGAAQSYLRAARLKPGNPHAIEELQRFLAGAAPFARADLMSLLRDAVFQGRELGKRHISQPGGDPDILFDVSSLVATVLAGYSFEDHGLKGDVLIPKLLKELSGSAAMCAHVVGHGRWLPVGEADIARIISLGRSDRQLGPLERQDAITDLDLGFLLSQPLEMPHGAIMLDIDADHAPADHALFVGEARQNFGIRYFAFGDAVSPALAEQADRLFPHGAALTAEAVRAAMTQPIEARASDHRPSMPRLARIEQLGSNGQTRKFRMGTGWLPPESWGCWTVMPGGELEIARPDGEDLRLYLRLKALPIERTSYQIYLQNGRQVSGEIEAAQVKWVVIDDLPWDNGVLRLRIRGENSRLIDIQGARRRLPAMVGVVGFYMCERQDRVARTALLEATALGDLESLY